MCKFEASALTKYTVRQRRLLLIIALNKSITYFVKFFRDSFFNCFFNRTNDCSINQSIKPLHRVRRKISGTNLYTGVNRRSTVKMVEAVFFKNVLITKDLGSHPWYSNPIYVSVYITRHFSSKLTV